MIISCYFIIAMRR